MPELFCCSTSSPTLNMSNLFYFSLSNWCIVISNYGFDLHFLMTKDSTFLSCVCQTHTHTHTHTQVKAKACMVQPVRIPRATFSLYSYLHREWAEEQAKGASSHGSSLTQQKEWDWGKKGQMTVSRKRGNPITEEPVLNSAQRFYIQPTLLMRWGLPGKIALSFSQASHRLLFSWDIMPRLR